MKPNNPTPVLHLYQIERIENYLQEGKIQDAILFYQEIAETHLEDAKQIIDNWILPEDEAFSEAKIQERASLYIKEKTPLYAIIFVKKIKKWGLKESIEYVYELM